MITMIDEILAGTWRPADSGVSKVELAMGDWCKPTDGNDFHTCGYAACIIGHAMLDARLGPLLADPNDLESGIGDYLCPVQHYEFDVLGFEHDATEYILFMPVSYGSLQGHDILIEAKARLEFLLDHGEEYFLAEYGEIWS